MPPVTRTLGEGTQSVLLTVAILECLARERQPVSISVLAQMIGTSKSRVFRHLRTLLACEYVSQDESGGHYGIGARLLQLCQLTRDRFDLEMIAMPFMEQLCEEFRHSVIVSRVESEGVHVLKSMSRHASIVLSIRPGTVLPFDRSAQGKIAMAFCVETAETGSAVLRARAVFDDANPGELDTIRRHGIAAAQMREGLLGLAAPIFDADNRLVGTLALLNTSLEMTQDETGSRSALQRATAALSAQLGYRRTKPGEYPGKKSNSLT